VCLKKVIFATPAVTICFVSNTQTHCYQIAPTYTLYNADSGKTIILCAQQYTHSEDIRMLKFTGTLWALPLAMTSAAAMAEITEIPPEEMTEAYIKDTTVIVREAREDELRKIIKALITVFPIDETYSEGNTVADDSSAAIQAQAINERLTVDQQQYLLELAQQVSYDSPEMDMDRHANDEYLRQILNLDPGTPIDYSNLQFPDGAGAIDGNNFLFTNGSNQLQLVIQNPNGYAPATFSTPNGEIGVNITPENINLSINLPGGN
tara:strand:+ start:3465 stop:4256 length:792 start_codon:yes stop_codon:yes gene_type:complete